MHRSNVQQKWAILMCDVVSGERVWERKKEWKKNRCAVAQSAVIQTMV